MSIGTRRARIPGVAVAAISLLLATPALWAAQPGPLSDVETAAVGLAAEYLSTGPDSWWDNLAPDSPLLALGPEQAANEIAVRVGSVAEARWTLQTVPARTAERQAVFAIEYPSGIDETLTLSFSRQGGGPQLQSVRISAEPTLPVAAAAQPLEETPPAATLPPIPKWFSYASGAMGLVFLLLAVFGTKSLLLRILLVVLAAGALGVAGLTYYAGSGEETEQHAAEIEQPLHMENGQVLLGSLAPLRRAVTSAGGAESSQLTAVPQGSAEAAKVARLWQAQYLLASQDLNATEAILAGLPSPGATALTELLRARLGFLRLEETSTRQAYERALELGGTHDLLLAEAAQAFYLLGFESQAQQYLEGLADIGSRLADAYYFLAQFAVLDNRIAEAIDLFTTGWQLQPMERAEVFANPLLAYLLDDITMREHLQVGSPAEPVPPCRFRRGKPVAVPQGTPSRVLGSLLVVDLAQGELWVPGGCSLASASAAVYDGQSWRRREETLVLSRMDELAVVLQSTGALTQPRIRRDLERATRALARRDRWQDLVDLTQGVESDTNRLPSELVRLRATALQRLDRIDEARALLIRLAKGNMGKRRVDSGTLLQLADLLIAQEEFDLALKLVAKADAETPQPIGYDLVQQIRLQKSLAEAYTVYRTDHFEIRYPRTKNAYLAEAMGKILESERRRLQRWIPLESNEVTQVHLLPWNDFQATWSGGVDLLGLFDGDIRLPFADIQGFAPELVAIVTHELAHAMLAELTDNRSPHWFQEGLAQHVQMVQNRINPIESYYLTKRLLAFPLVDGALGSMAAPELVTVAYDESMWTLHFLETEYGLEAIHGLQKAFSDGIETDEAITGVLGKSVEDFDRELWYWCLNTAPEAWSPRASGR
ncbi:MAG: hypothetical protein EP299_03130 [Acidobacteria bacterium]|nr:MAG: hypothetical protein EP299_03130 [Acidobacteriota bacterium]